MRTIKTTGGRRVPIDVDPLEIDLLALIEALFQEVTARRELERTVDDMMREIRHLIDQMTETERRAYFVESLFLNTVSYENEKLGAYMRKLTTLKPDAARKPETAGGGSTTRVRSLSRKR